MKIIQVHNYYKQAGGEDTVVALERGMIENFGEHQLVPYHKSNHQIDISPRLHNLKLGSFTSRFLSTFRIIRVCLNTLWNQMGYREFRRILQKECPDIVHCHNTFPLISPSIYWACSREGVPVVQTLHNYRLICPEAKFTNPYRLGKVCEACVSKYFKWPSIIFRCYRGSRSGSVVVSLMLFIHRALGTWRKKVTCYVALTEFQKQKMVEGGLPEQKIVIKPNFIEKSPDNICAELHQGNIILDRYVLYAGRLSVEKGVSVLVKAWLEMITLNSEKYEGINLVVAGDGPDRSILEALTNEYGAGHGVIFLGQISPPEIHGLMKKAECLVLPSLWYEGFPMTIVEAFSHSLPVITSDLGSMSEIVQNKRNGLKFETGCVKALCKVLVYGIDNPERMRFFGNTAYNDYREKYSREVNYMKLINIYERTVESFGRSS